MCSFKLNPMKLKNYMFKIKTCIIIIHIYMTCMIHDVHVFIARGKGYGWSLANVNVGDSLIHYVHTVKVKVNLIYAGWPIQHSGWYPEGPC